MSRAYDLFVAIAHHRKIGDPARFVYVGDVIVSTSVNSSIDEAIVGWYPLAAGSKDFHNSSCEGVTVSTIVITGNVEK